MFAWVVVLVVNVRKTNLDEIKCVTVLRPFTWFRWKVKLGWVLDPLCNDIECLTYLIIFKMNAYCASHIRLLSCQSILAIVFHILFITFCFLSLVTSMDLHKWCHHRPIQWILYGRNEWFFFTQPSLSQTEMSQCSLHAFQNQHVFLFCLSNVAVLL